MRKISQPGRPAKCPARTRRVVLAALIALAMLAGTVQAGQKPGAAGGLDPAGLRAKFLRLCDVAVQTLPLPERYYSSDLAPRKVPFYGDSYPVRSLAVAYDLTGKPEYLEAIRTWSDKMITFQEKMIPKGGYYMNYGREPFSGSGEWFVADNGEIAMGVLATSVRCSNPLERTRYLRSARTLADLVLDNFVGPNGGITNGHWSAYAGEWWASAAYMGPLFFRLYEETGDERYLEAGLNIVHWFVNLEKLRSASRDAQFVAFNAPNEENPYPTKPKQSAGGILNQLHLYNAGAPYIFSGYLEIGRLARQELAFFERWCSENLLGNGESGTFKTYDSRKEKVGGKFGAIPFQIYGLARQGLFPSRLVEIADRELERILAMVFAGDELRITELAGFAMVSLAEKLSPGSVLRRSGPLYKTGGTPGKVHDAWR